MADPSLALVYVPEAVVGPQLLDGRLEIVLESYAPEVPGFFLYYPGRAQRSPRCGCSWRPPGS